jgi:TolA-binding protein
VVAEYPTSRAMPDGLEGLAACEQRRGRPADASRLQARLTKDFPDSPAGKRASEHAQPVQGAAP